MKKYVLEIEHDEDSMNPRTEWDNITTMVCFHRRYNLGDKPLYNFHKFGSWVEMKKQIETDYNVLHIKPLFMFDHSGISISTTDYNDRFDSGQIGWVFIEEKQLNSMCGKDFERTIDKLDTILENEVKTYDNYLTGEVFKYEVYEVETCSLGHEHKTLVESCGSYYDEKDCRSEGESVIKYLESKGELV